MNQEEFVWSITLDEKTPEFSWSPSDGEEEEFEGASHRLKVQNAFLSSKAKDGIHSVNISTTGFKDEEIECPLAMFRSGLALQLSVGQIFNHEVKFTLSEGTGPIYLLGSHILSLGLEKDSSNGEDGSALYEETTEVQKEDSYGDEEDDSEDEELLEEEEDDEEEEDSPLKKPSSKKPRPQNGSTNGRNKGKKRKAKDQDIEEESDECEEESPKPPSKTTKKAAAAKSNGKNKSKKVK
uniref:Mitotic apparatus protein p62 n=1 Tax=Caligus rogercresseyi TaxID=217165 RepID=C1BMD8_CALRO|nr:Mitotic apparatus protein p62 [Caligus rogercresseyi]